MQSTFRCLEMHSKRGYKICIYSVILGELEPSWAFEIKRASVFISLQILGITSGSETFFQILLSIAFSNSKILGFHFSTKKNLTWEVKCEN